MKLHLSTLTGRSRLSVLPAFSLVELMVTISLIVILVAILLPSFGHARMQAKRARWNKYSQNLRADADALVYYAFDGEGEGNLIENRANSQAFNAAAEIDPRHFDLTLMKTLDGTRSVPYDSDEANRLWTNGRWDGKHAIYFNRNSGDTDWAESRSHSGSVLGGQDMTYFVSFALEKDHSVAQTPLMSVATPKHGISFDVKPWFLDINDANTGASEFEFYYTDPDDVKEDHLSEKVNILKPQFNHVVMSYSGRQGRVDWYLNGKKIGGENGIVNKLDFKKLFIPLVLGANFSNDPLLSGDHRYLKGAIDEAGIFLRAWDEEEVQSMAENGGVWKN